MWMNDKVLNLFHRFVEAHEHAKATERQNAVLQTNLDWMRLRITQLEKERAQLMYSIAGLKLPVPEFVAQMPEVKDLLNAAPHFDDPGEEEAARLGISHELDGTLKYGK